MDETVIGNEALIRAYGLYWVRDAVDWNKKALHGLRMHTRITKKNAVKKEGTANVWNQQGIYALYSDAKLMYVGLAISTEGIGDRLYSHHTKPRLSGRWDTFSWFGINGFNEKGLKCTVETIATDANVLIRTMELLLILAADPPMNRATGKFPSSERINQDPKHIVKQPTNAELMVEIRKLSLTKH